MRTRSPRIAPPVNGDDGSIASTRHPSSSPGASRLMRALVSVDLPEPGEPVMPTVVGLAAQRMRGPRPTTRAGLASALDEREEPGQRTPIAGARGRPASFGVGVTLTGHDAEAYDVARLVGELGVRSERDGGLADLGGSQADVDDLGDTFDAILQDALDPGLQRDGRRRARHARADELDLDHTGVLVHARAG